MRSKVIDCCGLSGGTEIKNAQNTAKPDNGFAMESLHVSIALKFLREWSLFMAGGGLEEKVGLRNFFDGQRVGQEKNWEGQSGHWNISYLEIFPAAAAFFHSRQYLTNYLQRSRIGLFLCYENLSILLLKSGRREIIARCRVGREFFCPRTKWAAKFFLVKCCFPPGPPDHK